MVEECSCAISVYFPLGGDSHHHSSWTGRIISEIPIQDWHHRALKHQFLLIFCAFIFVGADLLWEMFGINVICIRAVSCFCAVDNVKAECLKK